MQALQRNHERFPKQDRFGPSQNPPGQRGNCFQMCLAAILNLPVSMVPHFYDTDETPEEQWVAIMRWLAGRGWFSINYEWAPLQEWQRDGILVLPVGTIAIFGGKSPRGDFDHAVVGQIVAGGGWRLLHDPHFSNAGVDGDPTHIQVIAPLPWAPVPNAACRVCGCTDNRACLGGCWWVEADLCSACAGPRRKR